MGIVSVNVRMPRDLHAALSAEAARRKQRDPGASLNSLIIEALDRYLQQLQAPRNASDA